MIELDHYLSALEAAAGRPLGETRILPFATETAKSVFQLGSYVASGPRLAGLTWGAEDLPVAVGAASGRDERAPSPRCANWHGRYALPEPQPLAWRPSIAVYPPFRDLEGLRAYAIRGRRDGFQGMLAIHPAQVNGYQ